MTKRATRRPVPSSFVRRERVWRIKMRRRFRVGQAWMVLLLCSALFLACRSGGGEEASPAQPAPAAEAAQAQAAPAPPTVVAAEPAKPAETPPVVAQATVPEPPAAPAVERPVPADLPPVERAAVRLSTVRRASRSPWSTRRMSSASSRPVGEGAISLAVLPGKQLVSRDPVLTTSRGILVVDSGDLFFAASRSFQRPTCCRGRVARPKSW
jgi:hypothetical protein